MIAEAKVCRKCGKTLPIVEFKQISSNRKYRLNSCNDCENKRRNNIRMMRGFKSSKNYARKKRPENRDGKRYCSKCYRFKKIELFGKCGGKYVKQSCGPCCYKSWLKSSMRYPSIADRKKKRDRLYRLMHPNKQMIYYKENRSKIRRKDRDLRKCVVAAKLGMRTRDLPDELWRLKKAQLKLKKLCRKLKTSKT